MNPTNTLFILSDQHTRRALGCYGSKVARTPNIDALASRGTRFVNAYCQTPICVPSRGSIATGRYAHQIGSWDNATPYLGTEAPSFGHRLVEQGYRVTTIGKLHYRRTQDPSGFPDQRLPMHVLEGVGDLYGLLRGEMPVRPQSRKQVVEAGPGESDYIRYDRAIATLAAEWIRGEATRESRPWCLVVGFVSPHFPLILPQSYFDLYRPEEIPMPVAWRQEEWARHPVLDLKRRQEALDIPFSEAQIRNAMHAYYALVSFLDEQVGVVLDALRRSGQEATTRVIYSTDHGEMLGEHGLWWKSAMYESSVAVPLIIAGPDVPERKAVTTNAMLVDVFPTILESVGARSAASDSELPGRSLIELARSPDRQRDALSEYHAIFSPSGVFMIRHGRFKYIHFVGYPPQLFDLDADPDETCDLGTDPAFAAARATCEEGLRRICNPDEVDARARADQQRRIEEAGGAAKILSGGVRIPYTPVPHQFEPIGSGQRVLKGALTPRSDRDRE
jgi:choline-sulfatase